MPCCGHGRRRVAVDQDSGGPRGEATPVSLVADRDEPGRRALAGAQALRASSARFSAQMFEAQTSADHGDTFSLDFLTVQEPYLAAHRRGTLQPRPVQRARFCFCRPRWASGRRPPVRQAKTAFRPTFGERELSPISQRTVEGVVTRFMEAFATGFLAAGRGESKFLRSETNAMLLEIAARR